MRLQRGVNSSVQPQTRFHCVAPPQISGRDARRFAGMVVGNYFSRAARMGQFAHGKVFAKGTFTCDLALRGAFRPLLEISRHVCRVQRPFRVLHSISS